MNAVTGIALILIALVVFGAIGLSARRQAGDVDDYMLARSTQRGGPLALSFLASGLGAWVLFAPAEVAAGVGAIAAAGYALGAMLPILLFAALGTRLRAVVPGGHSLAQFIRVRFGRTFHAYVLVLSAGYMMLFLAAELTAVGGVAAIIAGIDPTWPVLAVAAVTLGYTAVGGLPASLRTDRWQAWLVLSLVAISLVALLVAAPPATIDVGGLLGVDRIGVEAALTLIIAVTVANLFHQGYWQRVWAARDAAALRTGAILGGLGSMVVVGILGYLGIAAAARIGDLGAPPVPVFALLAEAPVWIAAVVLVLGVALVASSVDTLENGLGSLAVAEKPDLGLGAARIVTIALVLPAVVVALQGYSVLQLFLIADLLCATAAVPAMLGLWRRATPAAALAGAVAGLLACPVPVWIATGSLREGLVSATFPGAIPTLGPFAAALVASTVVVVGWSLLARTDTDLDAVAARIPEASTPR